MSAIAQSGAPVRSVGAARLPSWWPLAALTLLGAVIRLATLDQQSFWYDEAFTVVRDIHPSLTSTLRSMVHTENTPPLWYLIAWADARLFGTGEVALRVPSALCGIATIPVAWAICRELAARRAAVLCAAIVAVNPLFVWYSQEARAYGLFVLCSALALLCFLRAEHDPSRARMAAFAATGTLALLSHYFALFLLIPMAGWLLHEPVRRRAALPALAALAIVCFALLPLVLAEGGHGTQWIGAWPLLDRLEAIPQYYLTGYSGASLGHGVELLVALPILAGVAFGLWRMYEPPKAARARGPEAERALATSAGERRGLGIVLLVAAGGILIPLALALAGADYLGPRNLVAAMIPVSVAIALIVVSPTTGRVGIFLGACIVAAMLAITVDVDLSPRLQRGNWRAVAHALRGGSSDRVIVTVLLGETPLQYYLHGLRNLPAGRTALVREIDEAGYAPLRSSAGEPPAAGFRLVSRRAIDGLIVYRFVSPVPRRISEETLRRRFIMPSQPEVLVTPDARLST